MLSTIQLKEIISPAILLMEKRLYPQDGRTRNFMI